MADAQLHCAGNSEPIPVMPLLRIVKFCSNGDCNTEAVTERDDHAYCYTCAQAYDIGYESAWVDAKAHSRGERG